jgi:Bacterial transcriptional repressor
MRDLEKFMLALQARGLMRFPADPRRLRAIIDVTWIVNENWLNYMDYHDREVSVSAMLDGYGEILEVLRPYLCADPQQITQESYLTIERLAAQAFARASEADERVAVVSSSPQCRAIAGTMLRIGRIRPTSLKRVCTRRAALGRVRVR